MIPLIDSPRRGDFIGGVVEILVIFRHDGPFLALQMVKLSSLHEEGGPDEVLYRYRRDALVNALLMVILSSSLDLSSSCLTFQGSSRSYPQQEKTNLPLQ